GRPAARRQAGGRHHVHRRRHGRGRPVRDSARLKGDRLLGVTCVLLWLGGCAEMPDMPSLPSIADMKQSVGLGAPAPAPPPDPKPQRPAVEERMAAWVEEQRLRLDPAAKPLQIDPQLSRIARLRAEDMAAQNYLAHAAPNGDTSASLLMAADAKFQGL